MDQQAIMIVPGTRQWTQQALHLACAMARDAGAVVVMVKMVGVNHPLRLDDLVGTKDTAQDRCLWEDCAATADIYGVPYQVQVFTYSDYVPGLVSAAEQMGAAAVFVSPAHSSFRLWNQIRQWRLRYALKQTLYTLETPVDQPSFTLPAGEYADLSDGPAMPLTQPVGPWSR